MLNELRNAVRRSAERTRNRRAYRTLLELDDHLLRDIGLIDGRRSSSRRA